MPVITDAMHAEVKRNVTVLYGKLVTKPALIVTDGIDLQYAADVDIGPTDPTGRYDQLINRFNGKSGDLVGLPGQPDSDFQLDDTLTINTVLHNCIIDKANSQLRWADVNSPVKVERTPTGIWRITGFSLEMPGTYTYTPVNLGDLTIGETVDLTVVTRRLTLLELGTFEPFGAIAFGATGVFLGDTLQKINV